MRAERKLVFSKANYIKNQLKKVGIDFIRLTTPTSDEKRLPALISGATGFIYYVSIAGITGTKTAKAVNISAAVTRIKKFTDLPIAIGFGIKTAEQAAEVARQKLQGTLGGGLLLAEAP